MKVSKGEMQKEKILKAAMRLFAIHGYQATSFQLIADKCKIHQPAIFYYFQTKEILLRAVAKNVIKSSHIVVSEHTASKINALDWMVAHFNGTMEWANKNTDEASILLMLYYLACQDKVFESEYKEILIAARIRIQTILEHAKEQNLLRSPNDLISQSLILHDVLLGSLINYLSTGAKSGEKSSMGERWKTLFNMIFLSNSSEHFRFN